MSLVSDLSSGLSVGKQGVAGSLTVTNTSTAPHNADGTTLSIQSLSLVPSCGQSALAADCPLGFREPGVFSVHDAVGAAGTACAGVPFAITTIDPAQDKLQFSASGPVLLTRPTGSSPSCRINFVFDVLKMPAADADPVAPGIQTARAALATAVHSDTTPIATISSAITDAIARAVTLIGASAEGGIVNTPMTDSATLTGISSAPALTGTLTFNLYGPEDRTCAAEPLLSSASPVTGNGTYPSEAYTPTMTGSYRWVTSYSGDANNAPASTTCNAPSQTVSVRSVTVLTGGPSRVGRLAATLTGSINAGSAPTTYRFEYGRSTQYGSQTSAQPLGAGGGAVPASAAVRGLAANTTYHYRLVATNAGGDIFGTDATFKTQAKAAARRLTLTAKPRRDVTAPHRFTFSGRLVRATPIAPSQACVGTVRIRISAGTKLVFSTRATLSKRCTYAKRVTIPRSAGSGRSYRVNATFLGNRVLLRKIAATSIHTG